MKQLEMYVRSQTIKPKSYVSAETAYILIEWGCTDNTRRCEISVNISTYIFNNTIIEKCQLFPIVLFYIRSRGVCIVYHGLSQYIACFSLAYCN